MKLSHTIAVLVIAFAGIHCSDKKFSSATSASTATRNDGGSSVPFGSDSFTLDGNNPGATGTNGSGNGTGGGTNGSGTTGGGGNGTGGTGTGGTGTGGNGTGGVGNGGTIPAGAQGTNFDVVQYVQGTNSGENPSGSVIPVTPEPLQVNCNDWIGKSDIYSKHMRNVLTATSGLPPRDENYPNGFSGISLTDSSLNQVCAELRCGPARRVRYRRYSSPDDNSIIKFENGVWLKFLAPANALRPFVNQKIDNKWGEPSLLCSAPGSAAGNIVRENTD